MPNKIKDIFSNNKVNMNGSLRFRDDDAYNNFLSALKIVHSEGRAVFVDGVTSITTEVSHQGAKFPLHEHTDILDFVVCPSVKPVSIPLSVGFEKKTIVLSRSQTKDKVILRTDPDSIVYFCFTFLFGENRHTVTYKVQFEKAKNIKEVADSFGLAAALLETIYKREDEESVETDMALLSDMKKYFRCHEAFFRRLHAIENELGLSISPSWLNGLPQDEQQDIDELYLLLCKKQVVRLNAKLTSVDSTLAVMNLSEKTPNINDKITLTFLSTIKFNFLKQTVLLHTTNLLVNAIVKDILKDSDGTVKVLYGDTDSKPMYIAFSAFKTVEEARHELHSILPHDETYINALTSNTYINRFYSVQ